jgi:RHS repeat-associated protein
LLWAKTDRKGQLISYFHDTSKRLSVKCYGALGTNYACTSPKVTYSYVGPKLTQVVNTLSTSQTYGYSYDSAYRVQTVSGPLANDNVTYGYDVANRVSSYSLESGPNANYTYYEDGSLKTQTWSAVTGQFLYTYTLNSQYDLITFPNGQTKDYTYDDQGRLTQLANVHPTAGNLANYAYGYDVDNTTGLATMLGQRSSLTATVPSQSFNNHQTLYYYDTNYQLNKTGYPNVAPFNNEIHEWTYDAIGNRLTNKINSATQTYSYYKNGSNPLNGQRLQNDGTKTYTYDNNGNLIGDGTYTYTWNKDNQITAISGGGQTISYKYDYMGKRISKTVNGVTTDYAYDGQNLIAELGASRIDYFFGPGIDEPLASKIGSNVYYYSADGLGSDSLLSDTNGAVQNKYVYDAWGIVRSQTAAVANSFGYTSREFSEVGLMYYRARYYNPAIGRFIIPDLLRAAISDYYPYGKNDPLIYTDPTGLVVKLCTRKIQNAPTQVGPFYHAFIDLNGNTYGFTTDKKSVSACCGIKGPGKVVINEREDLEAAHSGEHGGKCTEIKCIDENKLLSEILASKASPRGYCLSPNCPGEGINCQQWADTMLMLAKTCCPK